jgi:YesN/AraC family two-component response regulator
VILTDIQMPRMDGNTLIRELARHSADAVVILISGGHRFDDVFDGLRAGAVHFFLMKPWSTEQLVVAMNRARQESERRTRQRLDAAPPS